MKSFRKVDLGDRELNMFQNSVSETFNRVTTKQILDGQMVEVNLSVGNNEVAHKLGRNYTGWVPVRTIKEADISFGDESQSDKYIQIKSSAETKAWIWVF